MRQVALIPVFCALLVSTMGFLPGIERDDGTSMRATPSRKAIPVRPPSLPEALGHGRSGILSLLLQAGVDSDAGEKGGPGSLMLSLHGGSLHLPAREKREEAAVHAELEMVRRALESEEQEALSLLDQIKRLEERHEEQENEYRTEKCITGGAFGRTVY